MWKLCMDPSFIHDMEFSQIQISDVEKVKLLNK